LPAHHLRAGRPAKGNNQDKKTECLPQIHSLPFLPAA
jgi:hypothetical protein